MIQIKRVYDEPSARDGMRILVDRVWPRGISKERARIVQWRKDLAPSNSVRKWFGDDPAKWAGFSERYRQELTESRGRDALRVLAKRTRHDPIRLTHRRAPHQ